MKNEFQIEYQICWKDKSFPGTWVADEAKSLQEALDKLNFNETKNPEVSWLVVEKKTLYTHLQKDSFGKLCPVPGCLPKDAEDLYVEGLSPVVSISEFY